MGDEMKAIKGYVVMKFYEDGDLYIRKEMLGDKVYTQEHDAISAMIDFATETLGFEKYYITDDLVLSGYYQLEIDDGVFKEFSKEICCAEKVEILTH